MSGRNIKCTYCNSEAIGYTQEDTFNVFVECPTCGRYEHQVIPAAIGANIRDKVASYLYYKGTLEEHEDYRFFNFLGSKSAFDYAYEKYPWCYFASVAEIEAFYPKTFAERIDRILLGMAKKADFFGNRITYTMDQILSAMFIRRFDKKGNCIDADIVKHQLFEIGDYLEKNGYVESSSSSDGISFVIKPAGYKRIDELQVNESQTSKSVFIAMSFAKEMDGVREAIKKAVTECSFTPRIMDEIEHNHQIVPEMLYEIRQARFVIAELTGHNNGAYFEAGYALGQGKEVIQVCNKEKFGEDGHFDVKQINTVMWENEDELTEKLIARIKATVG